MWRLEQELDKDIVCCCLSSTYTPNSLPKKLRKAWETSKSKKQAIHTVKYADEFVLLAKEEAVLHGMIETLIAIGKCYGM